MKNRLLKISIIILELIFLYFILNFNIGCFFKKNFGIRCAGCGLTRAFLCLFSFDFIGAFKYNIMSIPLFLIMIIINSILLYDIICNKDEILRFTKTISKYYILMLILLFVTFIVNNVNKI